MVGLVKLKIFLLNKIANLFVKAIATSEFKSNSKSYQFTNVNLLADDAKTEIIHLREYGFYSIPFSGAECLVCFPNGSKDEGFILKACHQQYEPKPNDYTNGDLFMLHYKGHKIHLTDEGINIESENSKPITIKAKNVDIDLEAGGKFSVAGDHLTVDA